MIGEFRKEHGLIEKLGAPVEELSRIFPLRLTRHGARDRVESRR